MTKLEELKLQNMKAYRAAKRDHLIIAKQLKKLMAKEAFIIGHLDDNEQSNDPKPGDNAVK